MSDDAYVELETDYLAQLRHVNSLATELEVEEDKLYRLEAALIVARNRLKQGQRSGGVSDNGD